MSKKVVFKPTTINLIKKQLEKARTIAERKVKIINKNTNKRAIEECRLELKKIDSAGGLTNKSTKKNREYLQQELSDIETLSNTPYLRLDSIRISLPSRE